ncbi:RING-H2 finger protein ATL56-like [Macadamia integrifolia]|uniref:RING-H2 finger protein ATL56-like n=1 Tax=Macadamia integrifolia TaxID=60698 RepID=UPI001C4E8031|nr:RING-H2 finger protein ATL56-like [Macadamia integrifolia]
MSRDEEDGGNLRFRHDTPTFSGSYTSRPHQATTKPNTKLLSFFLKTLVMAFVISLFFIFLGIAAIVLLHICLAGGALQRRRRWRSLSSDFSDENSEFGLGLSQKELSKVPCFNYSVALERAVNGDCAVCLEGLREGEMCRILPRCKHVFHANCVDAWLIKVAACPLCRASVEPGLQFGSEDYRKLREREQGL